MIKRKCCICEREYEMPTNINGEAKYRYKTKTCSQYCSKKYARIIQAYSVENLSPEKLKDYKHRSYLKNKKRCNLSSEKWAVENPEKEKDIKKRYYLKNREKILAISKVKTKIFNSIRKSEWIHPKLRSKVIEELKKL